MSSTAAKDVALTLVAHGIDTVYCLPGEETIALLEAIDDAGIGLVVCRHEEHAAFMAAAHGRFTGSPGVVVTTLGPGLTNAITGLAQAHLCGFPVVAISGQKPARNNGEGSFQVLDLPAIVRPVTKWAHSVSDPRTMAADTSRAISVAMAPRPGPVLLEIPEDIAGEETDGGSTPAALSPSLPVAASTTIKRVQSLIADAVSPVLLTGAATQLGGIPDALTAFVEATGIGLVASQMGKGALAEDHPNSLRALSLNSTDIPTKPLLEADLIVAVGFQPVEHPPSSFNVDGTKAIVHIDTAAPEIEHCYRPCEVLLGDIAANLLALLPQDQSSATERFEATTKQRQAVNSALRSEQRPASYPPSAHTVIESIRRHLGRRDIVALDNGAYKVWFARHYPALAPNTLVLDNALATMGAGLATAMVAARLYPERKIVAVCGDGGFMMNIQDLETAKRLGLTNLTVLILNDDTYGFIAWHQDEQGMRRTAVAVENPDFVAVANAFGVTGRRVGPDDDLDAVVASAFGSNELNVVECPLDQQRNSELK